MTKNEILNQKLKEGKISMSEFLVLSNATVWPSYSPLLMGESPIQAARRRVINAAKSWNDLVSTMMRHPSGISGVFCDPPKDPPTITGMFGHKIKVGDRVITLQGLVGTVTGLSGCIFIIDQDKPRFCSYVALYSKAFRGKSELIEFGTPCRNDITGEKLIPVSRHAASYRESIKTENQEPNSSWVTEIFVTEAEYLRTHKEYWVARDEDGELYMFLSKPEKCGDGSWWGFNGAEDAELPESWFPEVTFESSPVQLITK